MKKSDKIESKIQIRQGEPSLWDIWKGVCTNKALLKHVIDNDLKHIWRIILGILSYLIVATVGFFLRGIV